MKQHCIVALTILALSTLFGCNDFFDTKTDSFLNEEDHYSQKTEVYSAFIGTAAAFQEVAEHTVLVSGLLGDLMQPTQNATKDYWDIYKFRASNGNAVVAPDVYYKVIINCNDFLRHVVEYNANNPLSLEPNIYHALISQVLGYRAWCYLSLAKLYGEVVYYDFAITDYTDLSDQPVYKLEELIDHLIYSINEGIDGQDGYAELHWDDILRQGNVSWNRIRINPNALMGELYLWKQDYIKALEYLMNVLNNTIGNSTLWKVNNTFEKTNWKKIFQYSLESVTSEMISAIPFDNTRQQENGLQYLFSNVYPNAFYIQPTDKMISMYESQFGKKGNAGDKYRGEGITYNLENGENVISKYHLGRNEYESDATVPIYRASDVHLMAAEALNRIGATEEALALVNHGLKPYWTGSYFKYPFSNPLFSETLKINVGVRGRADLAAHDLADYVAADADDDAKMMVVDSLIANEVALECAYEGKRWFALMRMAKHWNNPELLAEPVSMKFDEAEAASYKEFLMDPRNWFISYDQLSSK